MIPNQSNPSTSAESKVILPFSEVKNNNKLPKINLDSVCCECEKHFTVGSVKNMFPIVPMVALVKDEKVLKFYCQHCFNRIPESNILESYTFSEYIKHKESYNEID
jgi:hypothetical protein